MAMALLSSANFSYAADEVDASQMDHHSHDGQHMHMSHGTDDKGMDPKSQRYIKTKALAEQKLADLANKSCSDCHGKNGISKTDDNPNIAGQEAIYFCKVMIDYKHDMRKLPPIKDEDGLYVPTMNDVAKKLTHQEIVDLAEYYAHLRAD